MDLPLSDELFQRFSSLLLGRAGLHYPERRRSDLAHALSQAARAGGYPDLASLAAAAEADGAAWDALIADLTIGETYFFRNAAHFEALRHQILPDLLARRGAARVLRLWSAGCATGEEPYSLAIALGEALPDPPSWQLSILATDINPRFLQRAREALYGPWSFRETSDELRDRYFLPEGQRWRLRPEIRRQVAFSQLNLAQPGYPSASNGTIALDLIFCRNVTIYFDEPTTRQVAQRFYEALVPGGWLVVGHAEPHLAIYRQFETYNLPGAVIYRKPLSAPVFSTAPARLAPAPARLAPPPAPARLAPALPPARLAPPEPAAPPAAPDPGEELAAARAAADRGDWQAAQRLAAALVAAHPLYAPAHLLVGQIHEHAGELEMALAAYRRSVYLDPGLVMGTLGMAHIWRQQGHPAEARRALRGAQRLIERLPPDAAVEHAAGASAAELRAYVSGQLAALE